MTDEENVKQETEVKPEETAAPEVKTTPEARKAETSKPKTKTRTRPAPEAPKAPEAPEAPVAPVAAEAPAAPVEATPPKEKIEKLEKAEKPKIKTIPVPEGELFRATGRRKEAVARVILQRGDGTITINGRPADKYLLRETSLQVIRQPLDITNTGGLFRIRVNVRGGGGTGQAGAIKHGIARALCRYNLELRSVLKKAGHLRRDDREVERKKYGQAKARKRFQFSKR